MNESKVFIIAEAGVNHNGDINIAKKLCDAAKKAGVDAVKFQTWKTENLVTQSVGMAEYQQENIGGKDSQFAMLKKLELSYDEFREIMKYCQEIDIKFLSTPDESESLAFLNESGMDIIKVGSGEVTNIPYLREIAACKKDVIMSTGMSNLAEIETAYFELLNYGAKSVAILHCTTSYPCPFDQVNLRVIPTLRQAFDTVIGYSDHTDGIEVSIAAVALGAQIIEKHFTLDKSMQGPDHVASINPVELAALVKGVRRTEAALGLAVRKPTKNELAIRDNVLKKIVASSPIKQGEVFRKDNLSTKRSGGNGISSKYWDLVLGCVASKPYEIDDNIQF